MIRKCSRYLGMQFLLAIGLSSILSAQVLAVTPDELLKQYETEAKAGDKAFAGFSAERGEKFFLAERKDKKGNTVSCAGCHTKDPTQKGKTRANKVIEPMAVSANKERYTDKAKVEKWFKRNCDDVYERPCTAQEKGDFISFMKTR